MCFCAECFFVSHGVCVEQTRLKCLMATRTGCYISKATTMAVWTLCKTHISRTSFSVIPCGFTVNNGLDNETQEHSTT